MQSLIAYKPSEILSRAELQTLRTTSTRLAALQARWTELLPPNWTAGTLAARMAFRADPTLEAVHDLFERHAHAAADHALEAVRLDLTLGAHNVFAEYAAPILALVVRRAAKLNADLLAQQIADDAKDVADHAPLLTGPVPCTKVVAAMREHAKAIELVAEDFAASQLPISPQFPPQIATILQKVGVDLESEDIPAESTPIKAPADLGRFTQIPAATPALSLTAAQIISKATADIEAWQKAPDLGTATPKLAEAKIKEARAKIEKARAESSPEQLLRDLDDETLDQAAKHFGVETAGATRETIVQAILVAVQVA